MDTRWRIELLGRLRARRGEHEVAHFRRKAGDLLAYLSYSPRHPHPREALVELLWPECDPEFGRKALRDALHALRAELAAGDDCEAPLLVTDRTHIGLRPEAFTTDVEEFRAALAGAKPLSAPPEQAARLAEAVGLYCGDLLPDSFEGWVLTEREALRGQYLEALQQLVAARETAGDLTGALEAARQAVAADPLREEAHYDLMRLLAATGQPSACLRQYQELERLLREELDEAPSAEARALAEELRRSARTLIVARRAPAGVQAPGAGKEGDRVGVGVGVGTGLAGPTPTPTPTPTRSLAPLVPEPPAPTPALPVQLTRFFGREGEITHLTEQLAGGVTRLLTVTGPGGSGKTRLAIAVAGRLQELFGAAIAFLSLADLSDAGQIPDALAEALAVIRSPELDPTEQAIAHLTGQPWLLVLDNFEHLVEDGARLVRTLLERVATLTCLVTSRQRLGLAGEQEFALLPLPTPVESRWLRVESPVKTGASDLSTLNSQLSTLLRYPSVQLFVDRARAARASFALTEENAGAVAMLCDRLEGLPLAIELAAARVAVLTPEQILAQLEERFSFLVSRQREVPARHRSLRAAVETSYVLLPPELQRLFARLSVFRGGCTLEAATDICDFGFWILDFGLPARPFTAETLRAAEKDRLEGGLPLGPGYPRSGWTESLRLCGAAAPGPIQNPKSEIQNMVDALEQLRECSLVQVEEQTGGGGLRYRLLETLREFGWEQLARSGELAAIRTRHRDWYLRLAEQFAADHGPDQPGWLTRMEAERENLWAALAWCREAADSQAVASDQWPVVSGQRPEANEAGGSHPELTTDHWPLSTGSHPELTTGHYPLATAPEAGLRLARALVKFWTHRGYLADGLQWLEDALARGGRLPPALRAHAFLLAAHFAYYLGRHEQRESLLQSGREEQERVLAQARATGTPAEVAWAVLQLAEMVFPGAEMDAAERLAREARERLAALGDGSGLIRALALLAEGALWRGDRSAARPLLEERLAICRELGDSEALVHALGGLGHLARDEGNYARARSWYAESLALRRKAGYSVALAQSLEDLAALAGRQRQHQRAIRLLGAGEAFCETLGARPPVAQGPEYERTVAEGRAALGEAAFAAAWAEGRAMSLDEAVEYALGEG